MTRYIPASYTLSTDALNRIIAKRPGVHDVSADFVRVRRRDGTTFFEVSRTGAQWCGTKWVAKSPYQIKGFKTHTTTRAAFFRMMRRKYPELNTIKRINATGDVRRVEGYDPHGLRVEADFAPDDTATVRVYSRKAPRLCP